LLSFLPEADIACLRAECEAGRNPKEAKVQLATEIVTRFHGAAAAQSALDDFNRRAQGGVPDELPDVHLSVGEAGVLGLGALLKQAGLVASTSEAMRLIEQGGVRVDSAAVSDKALKLPAGVYVVQVGKRKFARVTLD